MDKPAQWALVGAAWFLALSVALLGFLAWHHFAASPDAATAGASAPGGSEAELALGTHAICPVSGEKLVISAKTPKVIYKDRVYYFYDLPDAAGILPKRRFLMDPEAVLHPGAAPTLEQQGQAAAAALSASAALRATLAPTAAPTFAPLNAANFPTPVSHAVLTPLSASARP